MNFLSLLFEAELQCCAGGAGAPRGCARGAAEVRQRLRGLAHSLLEDNGLCARVLAPPEDRQGVLKERVEEE
jgi:hypothetical protein